MLSLPAELDALCSRLLARCEQLDSARSLRAVFVTDDLAPFANGLPERAGSKTSFVAAVKLFLLETRLADGRVLLLPFLDAVRGVYPAEDALRGELDDLHERVLALPQATAPINRQDDAPQPPPDPPATRDAQEVAPVRLLALLDSAFDANELADLCFELGVDFENLAGGTKKSKARELILYCQRRARYAELVRRVRDARPGAAL